MDAGDRCGLLDLQKRQVVAKQERNRISRAHAFVYECGRHAANPGFECVP